MIGGDVDDVPVRLGGGSGVAFLVCLTGMTRHRWFVMEVEVCLGGLITSENPKSALVVEMCPVKMDVTGI